MIDYFPLGVTAGPAFCNRKEELSHLKRNIQLIKPTIIMSPRRYGKTSLALNMFQHLKAIYSHIDFYKEVDEDDIEKSIINGVGQLLGQIEPKPKQLLRLASEFFADMHVHVILNKPSLSIEISRRSKKPADNIQKALQRLQTLSEKRNKRVILFMDEFQKVAEITDKNYSIEAAIRHVAQISKNVIYIFSGSNRHLIEAMFFDSKRPFYKLCDLICLDRIKAGHYYNYIQKAASKQWKKKLSNNTIDIILNLTKCHPYYVNLLCSKLWLGKYPTEKEVDSCWDICANETRSQIEKEIDLLSFNQKKMIICLARYGKIDKPTGQDFLAKAGLSSTSAAQALSVLIEKDYIYKDEEGYYCLLDPLFAYVLA